MIWLADFEYININTTAQKIEKMANLETTYSTEAGKIPMFTQYHVIRSGTPINDQDCANKRYVDDAIADTSGNYYTKDEVDNLDAVQAIDNIDGNVYISADYDVYVYGSLIKSVGTPKDATDAATKGYVDGLVGDIETLLGGI